MKEAREIGLEVDLGLDLGSHRLKGMRHSPPAVVVVDRDRDQDQDHVLPQTGTLGAIDIVAVVVAGHDHLHHLTLDQTMKLSPRGRLQHP